MNDTVQEQRHNKATPAAKRSGWGIGVGFVVWAICFFAFSQRFHITGWLMWVLSGLGLLCLLVGVMGICVEIDHWRDHE